MKVFAFALPFALLAGVQADTVGGILKRAGVTINNCAVAKTAALTFDDGPNTVLLLFLHLYQIQTDQTP